MSKVLLDVRSGEKNDKETGLALRRIDNRVVGGGEVRGRVAYEIGSLGDVLWIAKGDGSVWSGEREITLTYIEEVGGLYYYATGLRDGVVESVTGALRILYGGTVIESDQAGLSSAVATIGRMGFWWTQNDAVRTRFEYKGGRWVLKGGGKGVEVSNGDEVGTSGELHTLDGVYLIGSEDVPLEESSGVVAYVEGGILKGLSGSAIYVSDELLGVESVVSGDRLSPVPLRHEYLLLREKGKGYVDVVYVEGSFGAVRRGEVQVDLLTGELLGEEGVIYEYEGLVLGEDSVGLVERISVPDGSGIEPIGEATGERPNGSGLVWALSDRTGWLVNGEGDYEESLEVGAVGSSVGCVYMNPLVSLLPVGQVSGSFRLVNGSMVELLDGVVVGGDAYIDTRGHLVVGAEVSYPTIGERVVLGELGLVPHTELGLRLDLTSPSVVGYYSFDDEAVGQVSGVSTYQVLNFEPRLDMVGVYGYGKHFKVGDRDLVEGVEVSYRFGEVPNGFEWIGSGTLEGDVKEATSLLSSSPGVLSGTSTLSVYVEGAGSQTLVEGRDYEVGVGGVLSLQSVYGERLGGGEVFVVTGERSVELDVEVEGLRSGDWLTDGESYVRIESVLGLSVVVSGGTLESGSSWEAYRGYREGYVAEETPDMTRLVGEVFEKVSAGDALKVYKVYGIDGDLDLGLVSSLDTLSVRVSGGSLVPLVVLKDERIEAPYYVGGDAHVLGGSYVLLIDDMEYTEGVAQGGQSFEVVDGYVVFKLDGIEDSSWVGVVLLRRLPLAGLDHAECDINGASLTGVYDELVEEVSDIRYEASRGVIRFREPLRSGVGVEASYFPLGSDERVTETLLFSIVDEPAESINGYKWSYNGEGREVIGDLAVYVGASLASGYSFTNEEVTFTSDVTGSNVYVSYFVTSSLGGESVLRLSSGVEVPKFSLSSGVSTMTCPVDVRDRVSVGDLISIGFSKFFVTSVTASEVGLSPTPLSSLEAESFDVLNVPVVVYDGYELRSSFRQVEGVRVESVARGTELRLSGDLSPLMGSGSLVITDGVCYRVSTVRVEEGVTILVAEGQVRAHSYTSSGTRLLVSLRASYFEGDKVLSLSTSVVGIDYKLLRYRGGVATLLIEGRDYELREGEVELVDGVVGGDQYYFLHTARGVLSPIQVAGGRVSYPRYSVSYTERRVPTDYTGLPVTAGCVVESPDTFQVTIMDKGVYGSIVASRLKAESLRSRTTSGKSVATEQTFKGVGLGLYDLLADDFVARDRIREYDGYLRPLDSVLSTATGSLVGDYDGQFKFELPIAGDWGGAGFEDPLTMEVYPRYVVLAARALEQGYMLPSDPMSVNDVRELTALMEDQGSLVENEIDDYLMVGWDRSRVFDFTTGVPVSPYVARWARASEPSIYSRLFNERTEYYTYRVPGDLDSTTNGSVIALVGNDAQGRITDITSLTLARRPARFRIVNYSRDGFADFEPLSAGKPTFILSAVELQSFPIDSTTGYPDVSQFITYGGDTPDVLTGDPSHVFGGLSVGDKLKISVDGVFHDLLNKAELAVYDGASAYKTARVGAIYQGCLVVLNGVPSSYSINGDDLYTYVPKRGDTLALSYRADLDESDAQPSTFRIGVDVGLNTATGELYDISLPSLSEPSWPLQELTGQNVPEAYAPLQGIVTFNNTNTSPFEYPALKGLDVCDAGDHDLPYLNTLGEREVLEGIQPNFEAGSAQTLNLYSGELEYEYPDEVRDDLTQITGGHLVTSEDFSNLNGFIEQTPRQGDLILLRPDDSGVDGSGATGIMELMSIDGAQLSPPFFETPSDGASYEVLNAQVHMLPSGLGSGVTFQETLIFNVATSEWDQSLVEFEFSNGFPVGDIMDKVFNTNGTFILHVYAPTTYEFHYKITFRYDGASWIVSTTSPTGVVEVATNILTVSYSATSIGVLQQPIPNVLTLAEEPQWPFNGYETWITNTLWTDLIDLDVTADIGVNTRTLSIDFFLNYRIDMRFGLNTNSYVLSDRLSFYDADADFTTWIQSDTDPSVLLAAGGGVAPLDVTPLFYVYGSLMNVWQYGGIGTQLIESYANAFSRFGYSHIRLGEAWDVIDANTLRVRSLFDIERTNDPMSLFVGAEVRDGEVIFIGSGEYGRIDPTGTTDSAPAELTNLVSFEGSLANVEEGDLVYIERGHNAGVHRVKRITPSALSATYTEQIGSSDILPVVFPTVVEVLDNGDGTGTLVTDSSDLSLYYNGSGLMEAIILLNDNYLTQPASTQNNSFDEVFYRSYIRLKYDSINGGSMTFTFSSANGTENPTYGNVDSNQVEELTYQQMNSVIGSGGQVVCGIHKVPFNFLATGLLPYEVPTSLASPLTIDLTLAGGLSVSVTVDESYIERDEEGIMRALLLPSNLVGGSWESIFPTIEDTPQGNTYGQGFLTPNDSFTLTITAEAAIHLDRAFPRLMRDYRGTTPKVFNDGTSQVRSLADEVGLGNLPAWTFTEVSTIKVRRLRRFSRIMLEMLNSLLGLKNLYEQKVGLVDHLSFTDGVYTLTSKKVDVFGVEALGGKDTQVGDFDEALKVGDYITMYDSSSDEVFKMKIVEATPGSAKGISLSGDPNGDMVSFKVTTRTHLIPQEQSFNEFLEHGFDLIYSSTARVPTENTLEDTSVDFSELITGTPSDYYLVIDPQGALEGAPLERGAPAQGDGPLGVGQPNTLDDNRGSYRVISVDGSSLTVEFISGSSNPHEIFLPSVDGDTSNPLRVTSPIDNGTYTTSSDSIEPFSYRILKRRDLLDRNLAEVVLFFRERVLSWSERVRLFNQLVPLPLTWAAYEQTDSIYLVGENDPTHPSNDLIFGVLTPHEPPYPYTDTMLSLTDRRLLVEDPQLEAQGHTLFEGMVTLIGNGISSMGMRSKRYAWINTRTNRVTGTLPRMDRIDYQNPDLTALEDII
jgi:hypothetical protein